MGKKCVFTFGRFQVPTKGHEELARFVMSHAKRIGAEGRIYASKTQDSNKNPLAYRDKVQFLRLLFPWANIVDDPKAISPFAVCRELSDKGYDDVTFVVGEDRADWFEKTIRQYILPKTDPKFDKTKHYGFKSFKIVSSGARVEGVSGTDMRNYIRTGNFDKFYSVAPTKNKALAKRIFTAAKRNLNEDTIDEVTIRDLTRDLSSRGWRKDREGGNHEVWAHDKTGKRIAIPRHKGDLKKGLVHGIMKQSMVAEEVNRKEFHNHLVKFVDYCCDYLGIEKQPTIRYKQPSEQGEQPSFAAYSPSNNEVIIMTKNRHPMDVFRSVAHELVHHKQNEDGRLGKDIASEGSTGSDIENEANSEAGKIMRHFGKAYPNYFGMSYITEEVLSEGLYDKGIFKAVFLAGGAGSGKDYILNKCIEGNGLKELNSDKAFEFLLKKNNIPMIMTGDSAERNLIRGRAKNTTISQKKLQLHGRIGVIINGTADEYSKILRLKTEYEDLGYDTMLVFVGTSNKVSRQRNIERGNRGGRTVPETIRYQKWAGSNKNKEQFQKLFGAQNFVYVDNSVDLRNASPEVKAKYDALHANVFKHVKHFVEKPVANPKAIEWIESQKRLHRSSYMNESFENMLNEVGGAGNYGTPKLTHRYQKDTPGQPIGFREMRILNMNKKMKTEDVPRDAKPLRIPKVPIGADRIGSEVGFPKEPSMGDNQTMPFASANDPIGRWMVKEETRKLFKQKYGKLAEAKIKETALRLVRRESLDDPFSGSIGATPNAGNGDQNIPTGGNQVDSEKQSLFGLKLRRKLNKKN